MKRTYSLNRIRAKRSYSVKEASDTLGTHIRTVQGWIKEGLRVLEGSRPYLIMGRELKSFLAEKSRKRKRTLAEGEFYCLRCKAVVRSGPITVQGLGKTLGDGRISVVLRGTCETCGGRLNRFDAVESETLRAADAQSDLG